MSADSTVSEAVRKKAEKYLLEGKVEVREASISGSAVVAVQGSGSYEVRWNGAWHCDCPARVLLCAHVVAAQRVVHRSEKKPQLPSTPDLDALLGGRVAQEERGLDYLL